MFRLQRSLRRRWLSAVVVSGLIAVVSGLVLTLAAGAQRTAKAPDAYTAVVGGEVDATITQSLGPPRTAEIAALPGVRTADGITFLFADVADPTHESADDVLAFAGSRSTTSRLVTGRAADPTNPREFVVSREFLARHPAHVGDHFRLRTWTRDQLDRGQMGLEAPQGPSFDAVLVGVIDLPESLEDRSTAAFFSKAVLDDNIVSGITLMAVRLDPGVTLSDLRSKLDALPDGNSLSLEPGHAVSTTVRNAVDAQARGIWILAAVAAVAAAVALGQLLSRHARLSAVERDPLKAIGFTSGDLAAETMSRAVVPAAVGILLGSVLAVLASGVFPVGFARAVEPTPGLRADFVILAIASAALLFGVLAWVGVTLLAARNESAARPSPATEALVRRSPSPAAATGVRFALTGSERSSRSVIATFVGVALLIAGVVGATTFAASLDRLVTDPGRYGANFTFVASAPSAGASADDLRKAFEGDPDVDGLMMLSEAQVRVGQRSLFVLGVQRIQGDLAPRVLSGRLPSGPDELVLGRVSARDLHLKIGDQTTLDGSGGSGRYRLVGLAVIPGLAGLDGVGNGGLVTTEGLKRLEPKPDPTAAAVLLRRDAPANAQQRITAIVGGAGLESPPSAIVNFGRVRGIPGVLAAVLAALLVLTLVHALIVSIQRHRRDLAVLRALGADGRWIERALHWQASVLIVAPLVLGVPLGVIAGSAVFRAFADRIGALPDPALPIVLTIVVIVGLIAVANIAALVPARRARLVPAARLLRDE